ncbi:DUF3179 domain-containing protein [Stieleria varia]
MAISISIGVALSLWSTLESQHVDDHSSASSLSRLIIQHGGVGFDLRNAIIPRNEIRAGGPPKDGIPALTSPTFVGANEADFLSPSDRVVGVRSGANVRAYPIRILNFHEIVNDQLDEIPFAVTYCPLCDSAAVFDRRTPLGVREFGVSGLLYNSNVLIYDRGGQPESLWSQVLGEGVSGPAAGKKLKTLPMELVTWGEWKKMHPETKVLSSKTGHIRDYRHNPYAQYFNSPNLMFPVQPLDRTLPAKTPILVVWTDEGKANAHRIAEPDPGMSAARKYTLGGKSYSIAFNKTSQTARVTDADSGVFWMHSFWFAWKAFHPETELIRD